MQKTCSSTHRDKQWNTYVQLQIIHSWAYMTVIVQSSGSQTVRPELFQVRSVAFLKNLSWYEKQMYTKLLYYTISLRTLLVSLRHYYDSHKLLFLQLTSGPQVLHALKIHNKHGWNGMLIPALILITWQLAMLHSRCWWVGESCLVNCRQE